MAKVGTVIRDEVFDPDNRPSVMLFVDESPTLPRDDWTESERILHNHFADKMSQIVATPQEVLVMLAQAARWAHHLEGVREGLARQLRQYEKAQIEQSTSKK